MIKRHFISRQLARLRINKHLAQCEDGPKGSENCINNLKIHGYSVHPNFLSEESCSTLLDYFDSYDLDKNNHGTKSIVRTNGATQLISDAFAATRIGSQKIGVHAGDVAKAASALIANPFTIEVTQQYLGTDSIHGSRIQLVQSGLTDPDNKNIPFVSHFDRVRFLKFYVYLKDTKAEDGALLMGSDYWVAESEKKREAHKRTNLPWNELAGEQLDDYPGNLVPIEGKAGQLVVFDSNQPHSHGLNTSGKPRYACMLESQSSKEIRFGYNQALANEAT